jgi:hypothetical protein
LRGASAVQQILDRRSDAPLRVFVVWEPMILTDLTAPSTKTLALLRDPRAVQIWDHPRLLAGRLRGVAGQPTPDCCDDDGVLWDLAAVYPKGARWTESPPPAVFFNGPVVHVREALERTLSRLLLP